MRTHATMNQILGCVYGGALGDAFASASEHAFVSRVSYLPSWSITDDTQLTLATCRAIEGAVSAEHIAQSFTREFMANRLTGLGSSTLGALRALAKGAHWALAGIQGERAAGNGAAMRIAPLAFLLDLDEWGESQQLRDVVRITHRNEEALAGAKALALGIQYLLTHPSPSHDVFYGEVASKLFDSHTRDCLNQCAARPPASYENAAMQIGVSGFAAHSVPVAMVAAMCGLELGAQEMWWCIVEAGGDTDTIASMAGQLYGAAVGYDALPVGLLDKMHDRAVLDEVFPAFGQRVMARR